MSTVKGAVFAAPFPVLRVGLAVVGVVLLSVAVALG